MVALKGFEIEPDALLLADQLVGPGPDRLLHEAFGPHLLVIPRRDDPAGAADIRGAEQDRKIGERLLEMEPDGGVANDLDAVGLGLQHVAPGAAVVLVAPFDVGGRDRRPIMELDPGAQPDRRALGVRG